MAKVCYGTSLESVALITTDLLDLKRTLRLTSQSSNLKGELLTDVWLSVIYLLPRSLTRGSLPPAPGCSGEGAHGAPFRVAHYTCSLLIKSIALLQALPGTDALLPTRGMTIFPAKRPRAIWPLHLLFRATTSNSLRTFTYLWTLVITPHTCRGGISRSVHKAEGCIFILSYSLKSELATVCSCALHRQHLLPLSDCSGLLMRSTG